MRAKRALSVEYGADAAEKSDRTAGNVGRGSPRTLPRELGNLPSATMSVRSDEKGSTPRPHHTYRYVLYSILWLPCDGWKSMLMRLRRGHRSYSFTASDVNELVELRARQRTFHGAYSRSALSALGYSLTILRLFDHRFYKSEPPQPIPL